MNRYLSVLLSGVFLLLFGGCASPGLDKTSQTIDVSKESIAIMSVNMTNQIKPAYRLETVRPGFVKAGDNPAPVTTGLGRLEAPNEDILVSVKMAPGTYELVKACG